MVAVLSTAVVTSEYQRCRRVSIMRWTCLLAANQSSQIQRHSRSKRRSTPPQTTYCLDVQDPFPFKKKTGQRSLNFLF